MNISYLISLILAAISWILFFSNFGFNEMYGWVVAAVGWTFIAFDKKDS